MPVLKSLVEAGVNKMLSVESLATTSSPTREELLKRIAALAPAIEQRRDEADRIRDVPAETISELSGAGLFRVLQPARWGGYESDPRTFLAIQNVIAEACPSTAWVYGVLAVQSLVIGRFDDRVQADVWGQDDGALVCSSYMPVGQAQIVEGGYRLSGRWSFSSGSTFARWALVGAKVVGAPPPEGPPAMRLFLIPRTDYEIIDVWNTFGMRGTGSNDLVANDIFVPAHRHVSMDIGLQNVTSADCPKSPLYRMPWLYLFTSTIANLAIGAARGALSAFVDIAQKRVSPATGKASKDDPAVTQAVARMLAEIDSAETMFDHHITRQMDFVLREEVMPLRESMIYRTQLSSELRKITEIVDELMMLQGSRATNLSSRVTRTWLDLTAARTHGGNDPAIPASMLGSIVFSAPA